MGFLTLAMLNLFYEHEYLLFPSLLNIGLAQVAEIIPPCMEGKNMLTLYIKQSISWLLMARRYKQVCISSNGIVYSSRTMMVPG